MTPERSLGRLAAQVVGTVVGAVLLHYLSLGPAIYLLAKVPATLPAVMAYFVPTDWFAEHVGDPPLLSSYLSWWIDFSGGDLRAP